MNIFKNKFKAIMALAIVVFSANSFAEVKLTFIEGKKFTDYEYSNESRPRSLTMLEKELNELLVSVTESSLNEKQVLEIDVTNIDLPGIIRYDTGRTLRVIDSNTPFRLYFDYRLKDGAGAVLKEGKTEIKEFSDSGIAARRNQNKGVVSYYEEPLEEWVKETLSQ